MDLYRELSVIGAGSFGRAVLVERVADARRFVMKRIRVDAGAGAGAAARAEVAFLRSLNHPNVVAYVDSFDVDGELCIVMEYAEGGDLAGAIAARAMSGAGPFAEETVLDWAVQLCLALRYVHKENILHRDVKPRNIFLAASGIVKLGDFGVAKLLATSSEFASTAVGPRAAAAAD